MSDYIVNAACDHIFDIARACGAEIDGGDPQDYRAGHPGSPPTITFTDRQLEAFAAALREQPEARGVVDVECRECRHCGHVGINDESATNAACNSCEWSGPSPSEDKCPGCSDENCMGAACPKCGALYRILAEASVALTAEQQPVQEGGGEVCPRCKGAGEYEGFARHASGDPQDEYAATVQCEPCEGTGEVAAPPSAPVGVELDAAALGRFAQDAWMDRHAAYPAWGRLTEAEQADWLAVGERIKRVVSLTQQPAQAAPGVVEPPPTRFIDGMGWAVACRDAAQYVASVRSAARAIAQQATPPGDDAAGGGHRG